MNAVLQPQEARFETLTAGWFEAVLRVEQSAYDHPWTRGNFSDSLQAGYQVQLLTAGPASQPELLGYFVAMKGVDEVHLLNITVAPGHQRQGWARLMLDALVLWSRGEGAAWLWLEVRVGNSRARAVYEHYGFRHIGTRRHYYPAADGQREDAVVMSLGLT
jgi:ribosomal-protein-alanine N-acetyltransferase